MAGSWTILSVVGTDIFLTCLPAVRLIILRIEFICTRVAAGGTEGVDDISIWAKAPGPEKGGRKGRLLKVRGDFAPKDSLRGI